MTRRLQLPLVQNVGTGQRVTIRMPLGVTYNKVFLNTQGNITASLISNIVLKINGSERIRWKTYAQLNARNAYNNNASDPNIVELDFIERLAKDEAAMTLGAIAATDAAGVQDISLEFDLGVYVVNAASIIKAWAEVDVPSANKLIVRTRYFQKVLGGASEESIILPFGQNGEQLKRLYIFGTLASITNLRVRREGMDEYDQVTQVQNEFAQKTYGKLPQAGLWVVDFTEHQLAGHMLNTALILGPDGKMRPIQNLDVRMLTNAAGSFDIYTESITLNSRP